MKPQKFIQSYKCECFQPHNYCNCPYKSLAVDVLAENVSDVAATLVEVMQLCGIPPSKAKLTVDVIIYYFLHFEETLTRIDAVPRKRLAKEHMFHDLHRKCSMSRMEAQMAYSIIKRAFRAFYHGSGEGGVPNPLMGRQLIHTPACMWLHAAKRTAQIYAAYEGLLFVTRKDIECKLISLYKNLYDRMSSKQQQPNENHECTCINCAKRIMMESLKTAKVTTHMHSVCDPYEEHYRRIVAKMIGHGLEEVSENGELKDSNKNGSRPCTCPPLKTSHKDLEYAEAAKSCNTGYSQGPFDCRWFSIDKEEYEADDADPVIKLPEEVSCPPCEEDHSSCVSECEVYTCGSEYDFDCGENGEGAVEDDEMLMAIEEQALSEDTTVQVDSDISDNEFSLKYSGCKNPANSLATSTKDELIGPQNHRKKNGSTRKSISKQISSADNYPSNNTAKKAAEDEFREILK